MKDLKKKLQKFPAIIFLWRMYHQVRSWLAAFMYGFPARKMVIIGITGTKGKTSTAIITWHLLHNSGVRTGLMSSAAWFDGDKFETNALHMTTPDPWTLHKELKKWSQKGMTHCVVEISSEAIRLGRHIGLHQDVMVYTNISPEHLPSHNNSYQEYRATKAIVFKQLSRLPRKIVAGKPILKTLVYNQDADYIEEFRHHKADKYISYSLKTPAVVFGEIVGSVTDSLTLSIDGQQISSNLRGAFNGYNLIAAIAICKALDVPFEKIVKAAAEPVYIPGRLEKIENNKGFDVYVDYAHEKLSMDAALSFARTVAQPRNSKVIVLLGAEGGGRDPRKRSLMGESCGKHADYVVVSNVDPYDDDPQEILREIAQAAVVAGKKENTNLFVIEDRREGIKKALSLAQQGDIVLLTGKGAEQSMILGENTIPWDDRTVAREELSKMS